MSETNSHNGVCDVGLLIGSHNGKESDCHAQYGNQVTIGVKEDPAHVSNQTSSLASR